MIVAVATEANLPFSQTDVPFSSKLECVKTQETQIISKFSGGGWREKGSEEERKEIRGGGGEGGGERETEREWEREKAYRVGGRMIGRKGRTGGSARFLLLVAKVRW